jgi:hypothetical protein
VSKRPDSTKSTAPTNTQRDPLSGSMLTVGVMEGTGDELWRLVRRTVRAIGPLKVVRRMGWEGYLHDRISKVIEQWGAKRVLKRLGVEENPIDMHGAAWEGLADLATRGKRLSLSTEAANRVALDLLDACADLSFAIIASEQKIVDVSAAASHSAANAIRVADGCGASLRPVHA